MTKGQIEAAVTEALTRFEREHLGRGPKHARTSIVRDMVPQAEAASMIGYVTMGMALAWQPVAARVSLVGTEAHNEIRFEPNLNGVFATVVAADVPIETDDLPRQVDLNPAVADADPPEGGNVDFTVAQLFGDRVDLVEFLAQFGPDRSGNAGVLDQVAQIAIRVEKMPLRRCLPGRGR